MAGGETFRLVTPGDDGGSLDEATIERMVEAVDERWSLRETSVIGRGGNETHAVTVTTPEGQTEAVLKASDEGGDGELSTEPRLLRLLAVETDVPVPQVLGIVDEHPDLPTPYFLLGRVEGADLPVDESAVPLADLEPVARELGRSLGAVHALDAFDGFGPVVAARDVAPDVAGGTRPLAREYGLTIPDPADAWTERFPDVVDRLCDRLAGTRYGDLAPAIRASLHERAASLDLSGPPAIARIDHHLGNVRVDDDGAVAAFLDWGIARTTHREYDLACAEAGVCGRAGLDSDRRRRLRAALYDGYRTTNRLPGDGGFADRRRLYLLTFHVAIMCWSAGNITPDAAADVEREFREFADALL